MTDAEVEDRGVAIGVASLHRGNVRDAVFIDVDLHNGIVDANAVEVPLPARKRKRHGLRPVRAVPEAAAD